MSPRVATRVAFGTWVLTTSLGVLSFVLIAVARSSGDPTRFGPQGFLGIAAIAFGTVGTVIACRRPENPIGWIISGAALLGGVQAIGEEYGAYAYYGGQGNRKLGEVGTWLANWVWLFIVGPLFTFVLLLFPDGHLPSRRWRPVGWLAAIAMVLGAVGFALVPRIEGDFDVGNPFGLTAVEPWLTMGTVGALLMIAAAVASMVALVLRFRRSRGEERAQMKWLVYSAGLTVTVLAAFGTGWWDVGETIFTASILLVPVAVGVAILRYRLYDIDLVINKTVVYGALAAFIALVYVGVVVGIGAAVGSGADRPNVGLSILATAVVALAFQPLRQRAQHLANRVVYGKRATPYEVLSEFADHVGETYANEDILPRTARILGEGIGATRAEVWLRIGDALRPAAAWPAMAASIEPVPLGRGSDEVPALPEADAAFPVRHQGELLGALAVAKSRREPVSPAEERLLQDLASQAGLVLRNARLTEELRANLEELRASRQRIVSAQDAERRRIERNIHDGAQQQLVALAMKLRVAESLAGRDAEQVRSVLAGLRADAMAALDDLRDLARGIYPPILADRGLVAALESQARRGAVAARVEAEGVGRYDPDVEAAVYFCALEALQNSGKYAGASAAVIRVWGEDGFVAFRVTDDGVGFDPSTTPRGSGLQNMADRLAALGGELEVWSAPGQGTRIHGRVPTAGVAGEIDRGG